MLSIVWTQRKRFALVFIVFSKMVLFNDERDILFPQHEGPSTFDQKKKKDKVIFSTFQQNAIGFGLPVHL